MAHCVVSAVLLVVNDSINEPSEWSMPYMADSTLRVVPLTFLLYNFSLLLFVACFTVVFVVDNVCQKRNIIGTDRTLPGLQASQN